MSSRIFAISAAAGAIALPAGAGAESELCWAPIEEDILDTDRCPAVFGDPAERAQAAAERKDVLRGVTDEPHTVNVVHQTGWNTPDRVHFAGLDLIETATGHDCQPVALMRLDPEPSGLRCESGLYAVRVDDTLGDNGRVLAIVDGVLLIERSSELAYLATPGERPVWRMIWHAPFSIPKAVDGKSSRSRRRRNMRNRRRRRKRRR